MAADMLMLENFINGKFVPCKNHIDSYDPSTGKVYCKVPDSDQEEVDMAVKAACDAFESWSKTPPELRAKIMRKIADLIESKLDEFAEAESRDQGKPVLLAKTVDIPRACLNLRFFASTIINASSMNHSNVLNKVGAVNYCVRCPIGVAGLISPWNLPLYLLTFKIAPAIAAGNTVVCKPSEMTSVTAWMMAKLMNEAGLPPGVCNLVFGTGPKAGAAIVKHPDIPVISFTGSTATGQTITQMSAPFYKKLSLELGGKNAAIVFDDADLEKCLATTIRSSFANQGEICLCTSRVFVQKGIFDKFLEKFVEKTRQLQVGSPKDPGTNLGALISKEHLAKGYEPTLLRTQYRCHPAISAISNRLFYDNKLLDGVSDEDRSPIVNLVPTLCFFNVAKGREKCGNDGSYYNEEEAKFVVFLIESLLESGMQPSQIGVITLYKSQLRTVASQLTASGTTSHAELKAIQISTVDAFQGGEKDVIILSCVRTDHIGFIDCDKRSNVALTRAKRHLLIVGNLKMLSCNAVWGKVIEHCGNFPNGLCNSDVFMEKCQEKESNALDEDLEDSKGHADQLSNVGRQNAVKVTSDSSSLSQPFSACAGALRKGFETETRPCEENTSSVDIIDTNGGGDEDNDFDLPTFDLISSLGI